MSTARRAPLVLALATAAICWGGSARAEIPFAQAATWSRPQASAGMRFGTNHLNLGVGARGGYTLPQGVYIGGSLDYFLGESSAHVFDIDAEGGYDFKINDALMVRPFIGLGIAWSRSCVADVCSSGSDTFIGLGGLVDYFLPQFFIGGELRIMSAENTAVVIGAHVGLMF
jgi:hypothetical protein